MANDPQKIRFAPHGGLYMAPAPDGSATGTKLPELVGDGVTAPAGYKAFGYVTEDGVTITPAIQTNPVTVWQSAVPVLYNVQSASFQVAATLQEVNQLTTELFFGAKWIAVEDKDGQPTGNYRLDLSSSPDLTEISLVVDWSQGNILYRSVIPRAMVSERGAIQLQRTNNQQYQLTIDALDYNGTLGYVLTNDDILGTNGTPAPVHNFAADVTVPNSTTNDGTAAAWTVKVQTHNQTGPVTVSLLRADNSAWDVVGSPLQADGSVTVTVPVGRESAEVKVNHAGLDLCYQAGDNSAVATVKTSCTVAGA
ncbi:phage tail tube protein [Streptomyces sp. H39-S7]|uniref:phage tail tube protein n=1 Tax=Streptomyces sp. H39-S7 TaxID=3004357 RepID=UPI0022B03C63|nr:hypothetical protein [Streptomyces sp. H39-S7]MCZ4119035.1 hypothetical protein [Streptomyces sp. H39-S7]